MSEGEVRKVVTHTGDVYLIKLKREKGPRAFYVSSIGPYGLTQEEGGGMGYDYVSFASLEWVRPF